MTGDGATSSAVQAELLAWFDRVRRDLPWRRTSDPYAILVSEIMLQQTRVETVIPYYARFLERFPTAEMLAAAAVEDVLSAWSGLGYYRRARALHGAAKEVVARYGGAFPATAAELRSLPGVGDYTSGAVASIAFGERAPAIDGNVTRVFSRWIGLEEEARSAADRRRLRETVEALIPEERAGDFNQALMELGATVCTPTKPRCDECPLRATCVAGGSRSGAKVRRARPTKAIPRVGWIAAAVVERGGILLGRRPLGALFGGLWEPPAVEGTLRAARGRFRRAGIELLGKPIGPPIVHVLSHRILEVTVALARAEAPGVLDPYEALEKKAHAELAGLPMSALARRIARVSFAAS